MNNQKIIEQFRINNMKTEYPGQNTPNISGNQTQNRQKFVSTRFIAILALILSIIALLLIILLKTGTFF